MAEGMDGGHEGQGLTFDLDPASADHVRELARLAGLAPGEFAKRALENEGRFVQTTTAGRLAITAARWFADRRIPEPVEDSNVIWVDFPQANPDIPPQPPKAV